MLKSRRLRAFRLVHLLALVFPMGICLVGGRTAGTLLWLVAFAILFVPAWCRTRVIAPLWILMLALVVSPWDVSLQNRPGPPHFAPLVMGYPTRKASVAARRGEIVLGGCIVTGYEPLWVWVW